jgi:hypothetical protein
MNKVLIRSCRVACWRTNQCLYMAMAKAGLVLPRKMAASRRLAGQLPLPEWSGRATSATCGLSPTPTLVARHTSPSTQYNDHRRLYIFEIEHWPSSPRCFKSSGMKRMVERWKCGRERVRREAQSLQTSWGLWRSGVVRCGEDLGSTVWLRKDGWSCPFALKTVKPLVPRALALWKCTLANR